ncbi:MAG TPA: DedA family protein [Terriglobales bacterium]|nr:DedA family protein [Terriglobales bacterium]
MGVGLRMLRYGAFALGVTLSPMISRILEIVGAWIVSVISAAGYPGVMLLMAIESACIPLPSEIIMPFSGYLVYMGRFSLLAVATFGALGCNLGSMVAYEIGYFGGRPLVERYGRYVLLSHRELAIADRFFERRGAIAVLIARLLPVIRTFIALPAGIARMNRLKFHLYTFVGSWPWCFGLAYIGMRLGKQWATDPRLKMWFHRLDAVILGVIVLALVYFIWSHLRHRVGVRPGTEEVAD